MDQQAEVQKCFSVVLKKKKIPGTDHYPPVKFQKKKKKKKKTFTGRWYKLGATQLITDRVTDVRVEGLGILPDYSYRTELIESSQVV